MFLNFSPSLSNKNHIGLSLFLAFSFLVFFFTQLLAAENNVQILTTSSIESEKRVEIIIKFSGKPISTIYELPNPNRIVVDIAEAIFSKTYSNPAATNFANIQNKLISDAKPSVGRIEIILNEKMAYESIKKDTEIILNLTKPDKSMTSSGQANSGAAETGKQPTVAGADQTIHKKNPDSLGKDKIGGVIGSAKSIENQLPDINPLENKISQKAKEQQMQDAFNFSGYNKDRITVEFQKMDLHNVFNFLRQVSGVNIVVDESVQGSLTLVLDDVPWDFALDIILNLKDLEKEERFNTLVIYPKKKEFKWPEKNQNNLSFQSDSKVVEKESLIIRQHEKQPVEVAEAKQDIALGKEAEKSENFEFAVRHYEKALEKWSGNSKLANKIASIYLINLRQNAKSLYFSKIALEKDTKNLDAALNAAIASANMHDWAKAASYFTLCMQGKKPPKEALISYAAFLEDRQEFPEALRILDKYNLLYGEELEAMVAEARIFDKSGQRQQATDKYRKISLSGYNIPPDLDKYIKDRTALN